MAQEPELVTSHQLEVKPLHNGAVTERFREVCDFRNDFAAFFTGVNREIDAPDPFTACGTLAPQFFEALHTAFVTRPAGFNPFADPHLFLGVEFVKAGALQSFRGKLFFLAGLVGGKVSRVGSENPAVQLNDACDGVVQKRAVVGDHHQRPRIFKFTRQNRFKRENRFDVQVVCGFVK